jgi:subtilisin family serine protease
MLSLNKTVRWRNHLSKAAGCMLLLLVLAALTIPATPAGGVRAQGQSQLHAGKFRKSQGADAIPDQYIVVLRDDIPGPDVDSIAAELAHGHGGTTGYIYQHALKGFSIRLPEAAAMALSHDPRVKYVEEDGEVRITATQFSPPWGLDRIDQRSPQLSGSYTYTNTGAGVHAYVIDTGIFTAHTQFGGRIGNGFTAINDGNGTNDCDGHGTHVAGIIGGSTYGVAKGVTLHPVRVLNCEGRTEPIGTDSSTIAGVNWVTANRILPAVANMSLIAIRDHDALDEAVRNSINSGVTYVVGAGNDNMDAANRSPARVAEALTVGATGNYQPTANPTPHPASDQRASFSNWGPVVDLFAPGVGIPSAWPNNLPPHPGCTLISSAPNASVVSCPGTSMAAPHVAGAAALYLQTHQSATPNEVGGVIRHTATKNAVGDPMGSPNRLLFMNYPMGSFTVPIYRYWNASLTDHYYSMNYNELGESGLGWDLQKIEGFAHTIQRSGTVPLYRYWNPERGDHFYTTNFNELGNGAQGWILERVEGYVYSQQQSGTVPLYRYWNSSIGDHYYTTNFGELGYGANGYNFEWVQCYILPLN